MNVPLPAPPVLPVPVAATDVLNLAAMRPDALPALDQKFQALMNRAGDVSAAETTGSSAVAKVFIEQDAAMRQSIQDMDALAKVQGGNLSDQEMTARHIELTYRITTVQFQFNAGVFLAQGTKNGLQTLIKNQ